jgi:predicted nucleotidyltransferase
LLYTVYEEIQRIIKSSKCFTGIDHEIVIFGSALNGLYDKFCSDLDLTLIVHRDCSVDHQKLLFKIHDALEHSKSEKLSISISKKPYWMKSGALLEKVLIQTKVEMFGYQKGFRIEVDFLVNRYLEVLNS